MIKNDMVLIIIYIKKMSFLLMNVINELTSFFYSIFEGFLELLIETAFAALCLCSSSIAA